MYLRTLSLVTLVITSVVLLASGLDEERIVCDRSKKCFFENEPMENEINTDYRKLSTPENIERILRIFDQTLIESDMYMTSTGEQKDLILKKLDSFKEKIKSRKQLYTKEENFVDYLMYELKDIPSKDVRNVFEYFFNDDWEFGFL